MGFGPNASSYSVSSKKKNNDSMSNYEGGTPDNEMEDGIIPTKGNMPNERVDT